VWVLCLGFSKRHFSSSIDFSREFYSNPVIIPNCHCELKTNEVMVMNPPLKGDLGWEINSPRRYTRVFREHDCPADVRFKQQKHCQIPPGPPEYFWRGPMGDGLYGLLPISEPEFCLPTTITNPLPARSWAQVPRGRKIPSSFPVFFCESKVQGRFTVLGVWPEKPEHRRSLEDQRGLFFFFFSWFLQPRFSRSSVLRTLIAFWNGAPPKIWAKDGQLNRFRFGIRLLGRCMGYSALHAIRGEPSHEIS